MRKRDWEFCGKRRHLRWIIHIFETSGLRKFPSHRGKIGNIPPKGSSWIRALEELCSVCSSQSPESRSGFGIGFGIRFWFGFKIPVFHGEPSGITQPKVPQDGAFQGIPETLHWRKESYSMSLGSAGIRDGWAWSTHSSRIPAGNFCSKTWKKSGLSRRAGFGILQRDFPINSTFLAVLSLFSTGIHGKLLGFMENFPLDS